MSTPVPLHTPFRCLPQPLQRAVLQFVGLPGRQLTAERLASLVDGHLEAYGMTGDARRPQHLAAAFAAARQRFGVVAERRAVNRP